MRTRFLVSSFFCCGVSLAAAQPNPSPKAEPPAEPPLPAIFAPRGPAKGGKARAGSRPLPPPSSTRRAVSPETAAKLSAVATRAAPVATATPPTSDITSAASTSDSSDAVQLTPYVVQEERLPEFKEREMLTPKGKLSLARRRYPGLVGPLSDGAALRMLEEDFAKERRQELTDLQGLLEIGGAKPSRELKRQIDDALVRPSGLSIPFGEPFRPPK